MNKKIIKLIKRSTFCNCSSIIVSPFPMGEWSSVEQLCSEGFDIDTVLSSVIREWGIWSGLQWFSMTTCPPPVTSHTTCTGCNSSEKMAYFINFEMASFLWRVFVCDNNIYIYIGHLREIIPDKYWTSHLEASGHEATQEEHEADFSEKWYTKNPLSPFVPSFTYMTQTSSDCILHHDVWIRDV